MKFKLKQSDKIGFILFFAFVLGTTLIYQFEERFSEDLWKDQPTARYKLADDIIERDVLIDKTKKEIVAMLGLPNDYSLEGNVFFSYYLGEKPSFSDSEKRYLILNFTNDRVVEVVEIIK